MSEVADPPIEATSLSGRLEDGVHVLYTRVYYEDTDAAGIVYYANYLRFAERARTEMLRLLGVSQADLRAERGLAFAVRRCTADYRRPARLDDLLEIRSHVTWLTRVQVTMAQAVRHAGTGTPLADLEVNVVCLDSDGRPARIPPPLPDQLHPLLSGPAAHP
jgi:acyl-CoA thioester hydrolase